MDDKYANTNSLYIDIDIYRIMDVDKKMSLKQCAN